MQACVVTHEQHFIEVRKKGMGFNLIEVVR